MDFRDQMTDLELEEWQKEQLDQCLVENTINKLIETYEILEQSTNVTLYNERSHNLEESAILMAISEHGLHHYDDLDMLHINGLSSGMNQQGVNNDDDDYSDDDDETSNDATNLLEAAVSLAIQKQGLGVLGPHR